MDVSENLQLTAKIFWWQSVYATHLPAIVPLCGTQASFRIPELGSGRAWNDGVLE